MGFQEPTAVPPDLHSAEDEQVALRRRERFQEQRRRLMEAPAGGTHFVWDLPGLQEKGSDSDEEEETPLEPGEDDPNQSASEEPGKNDG